MKQIHKYIKRVRVEKDVQPQTETEIETTETETETEVALDRKKYIEYYKLTEDEKRRLIDAFVGYVEGKGKDIEEYINYEGYIKNNRDEHAVDELYCELYEVLADDDTYDEICE
jgi:hypothetical protein